VTHPRAAHTAVVYVNKFRVAGLLEEGIDSFMEQVGGALCCVFGACVVRVFVCLYADHAPG
jgi:hypothetical protein